MKRLNKVIPLFLLASALLSACGGSGDEGNSQEVLTQAAQIAIDGLTQTAGAAPPTATDLPEPTPTNTPEPSPTFTNTPEGGPPTAVNTQQSAQQGSNKPCWRGNLEYETIPDGSIYYQNKVFTKVWRIKNTGTCTWPADLVAIWVQGDLMGASSVLPATTVEVLPNEYIEITVDFQSSNQVGFYKGYWMLRGGGAIFGVGTTGLEWFWVEIETQINTN